MIIAGIVLFNPNIERLKKNIDSIINKVNKVVCIDNNSTNINEVRNLIKSYKNIDLIENDVNKGISYALNEIFKYSEVKGYKWVLTLDQDSICPNNLVDEYKKFIHKEEIGILTPVINDINAKEQPIINGDYEEVDKCITSGSLTRIDVWKDSGMFNEDLFIDFVDFDFCQRVRIKGYKVVRINTVTLFHEVGREQNFKIFNFKIHTMNHNAFRKYYIVRNYIFYIRVYKEYLNVPFEVKSLVNYIIKVVLFEDDKINKIKSIYKGICDSGKLVKQYNNRQ